VLPAERRVRRREDFIATVGQGRRVGARELVVHRAQTAGRRSARAGFIVGRGVGSAVVRNRVRRRLRHLMATRLARLPDGTMIVVRANPPAAGVSAAELGASLDALLARSGQAVNGASR
jgi:ribonuclease P protein component